MWPPFRKIQYNVVSDWEDYSVVIIARLAEYRDGVFIPYR